jgi:internalin A
MTRKQAIDVWADTRIKTGDQWKDEITKALSRAKVAVLLVSRDFLASDFIADEEIPPILAAAKDEGLKIVWVPVGASLYEETPIMHYQAAHDPRKPLKGLSEADADEALVAIAKEIRNTANP